jgi:hypothetical protein
MRFAAWGFVGISIVFVGYLSRPRFVGSYHHTREMRLRSDLKIYRNAISLFTKDTGASPRNLADLAAMKAPAWGWYGTVKKRIDQRKWLGPYVDEVMKDPCSGNAYLYNPNLATFHSSDPAHASW